MLPPPPAPRPTIRPAFVAVLALVALPILVLIGIGFVTDDEIDVSTRLVMAPIFILGVCVAPVVVWRRLVRRGAARSDALATALGLAVGVLALDLTVLARAGSGALFLLAQVRAGAGRPGLGSHQDKRHPSQPGIPVSVPSRFDRSGRLA